MGSGFFGGLNMGSSSSSSSSSRKGKKNSSDKPKQPQRGLGVAQLEKIRLHSEMSCNSAAFQYPNLHSAYSTNFNQEEIRMQGGYTSIASSSSSFSYSSSASSAPYGYHPSMMMGLSEYERANHRYGESHHTSTPSWNPGYGILESQQFAQPNMTRPFLNIEDANTSNNHHRGSMGSSSPNSESGDSEELDLELRLSL